MVNQKTLHRYEMEAKKLNKSSFVFAWVLDQTEEERYVPALLFPLPVASSTSIQALTFHSCEEIDSKLDRGRG